MFLLILFIILVIIILYIFFIDSNEKFTIQAIPNDIKIRRENCLSYCNERDCLKMFRMQKDLSKCIGCNLRGLCYKKRILGGTCGICSENEKFFDCNKIGNFGCTNPENIVNFEGVDPYYIIIKDKDSFSYKEKCKFCWNI